MIAFSHIEYHKANAFGKVEDQMIREIKALPNFLHIIESTERYPEIEMILRKYQGVFELPQNFNYISTKSAFEQISIPNVGVFEVE